MRDGADTSITNVIVWKYELRGCMDYTKPGGTARDDDIALVPADICWDRSFFCCIGNSKKFQHKKAK